MANPLLQEVIYLKENGFSEQQASAMLFVQKSHIDTYLATKKDVLILEKDIGGVKKEVVEVKKDIEGLKKEVAEVKKDIAEVKKDIEGVKKEVVEVKKDIEGVKKEVAELKKDIEEVKKDIVELKTEVVYIRKDMEGMRLEFKKDMEGMRLEFKQDMEILKNQLTIRLGSMVFAGFLLLAGYINYLNRSTVQVHLEDIKNQIVSALERNKQVISPPSEQKQNKKSDNFIKKP